MGMKNHYSLLTEKGKPWRILQVERVSWKKMVKAWFSLGVLGDEGRRVGNGAGKLYEGQHNKNKQALSSEYPSAYFKVEA